MQLYLFGMLTCTFGRGSEVGVRPIDRLNASTLSRDRDPQQGDDPNLQVGGSQQGSWASKWGNPAVELGSQLLPSWDLTHQRSCELGKHLNWGCNPLTYWMH